MITISTLIYIWYLCMQGQYAFVIYDDNKGTVFAARDPSSDESLFYYMDDSNGSISLSNAPLLTPDAALDDWQELPPGHFVSGRSPKVQQFALTPDELHERELAEHLEDSLSLSSSPEDEHALRHMIRRYSSSLEGRRLGQPVAKVKPNDGLFAIELGQ